MVGIDILFLGMMAFCGILTYVYFTHDEPSMLSKLICGGVYGLSFLAEKLWPETIIMLMMQISLCFFYALWLKFDW